MEYTEQNLMDDLNQAKLRLLNKKHNTFIGSLFYDLDVKAIPEGSASIDSINQTMYINPNWFCGLTHEQQASVIAHEVYHYALMHDVRKGRRDDALYQKACDHVVNNLLEDSGFELPSFMEHDPRYQNMSTESVYNYMEEQQRQNQSNNNSNSNNNGGGRGNGNPPPLSNDLSFKDPTPQQLNQIQSNIQKADIQNKMVTNKSIGQSNAAFEQLFKDIHEGKLSWKDILANHLDELSQGEYDWARPNKRYLPLDLYIPSNQAEHFINKVAVAFDVSGSVSYEEIKAFLSEMKKIKNQLDPETMDVVTFNNRIVELHTFKQSDSLDEVKMKTRGGTNLKPVFDYYKKPENSPKFLIVFSDLYCDKIPLSDKPNFEVVWVCISNPQATVDFGKLIHITTEDLIDGANNY